MKDVGLKISADGGRLVISIGIDTLCHAVEIGRPYGLPPAHITDTDVFIKEFINELESESEDGTTAVHTMFDRTFEKLLENGALGVDFDDVDY